MSEPVIGRKDRFDLKTQMATLSMAPAKCSDYEVYALVDCRNAAAISAYTVS